MNFSLRIIFIDYIQYYCDFSLISSAAIGIELINKYRFAIAFKLILFEHGLLPHNRSLEQPWINHLLIIPLSHPNLIHDHIFTS